jgi:hypothetical protein
MLRCRHAGLMPADEVTGRRPLFRHGIVAFGEQVFLSGKSDDRVMGNIR